MTTTTELPGCVELQSTDVNTLSHQRSWFVRPVDDHMPLYSSGNSGEEASIKSCHTWLKNRGYVESAGTFPENLTYVRKSTGTVSAKASKLDDVFQTWIVKVEGEGIYYWHKQSSAWLSIPSEWIDQIVWD